MPAHLSRPLTDFCFDQPRNAETQALVLSISGPLQMHAIWRKELIMSSRSGASLSGNAKWNHGPGKRRAGRPSMSESQTQAYLLARDVLRRIRRTSSLMLPTEDVTIDRRGRSVSTRSWDRRSTARLISGLRAERLTLNATCRWASAIRVLFSDMCGANSSRIRRCSFIEPGPRVASRRAP